MCGWRRRPCRSNVRRAIRKKTPQYRQNIDRRRHMSDSSNTPKTKAEQTKLGAPIRVIIIEDMRDVREGLMSLINVSPGFHCVGGYRSVEDALAAIAKI